MSLLKCNKCKEMYSDSYKECPFCLEDEEFYSGRKAKNPGRRVKPQKTPSIVGPAMVLVVLLLAGYLTYTFLGGTIAQWFDNSDKPGIDQPIGGEDDPQDPDDPGDPYQPDQPDPPVLLTVTVDQSALTLVAGNAGQLKAEGADIITWASSDETVATVDATGKVTAVKAGSATITASAEGATSAACVVTVTAPKKDLTLQSIYGSSRDISIRVGQTAPMEVLGTDSPIEWSMEDSSVASVDEDGYVTGLSRGITKIIAKVDGQTLTCILRVG